MIEITQKILRFWFELGRRKTIRALAGYLLILVAVVGPASDILGGLGAPEWVLQLVIYCLFALFPVVLGVSWVFDLTPNGFERTDPADSRYKNRVKEQPKELKLDIGELLEMGNSVYPARQADKSAVHFTILVSRDDQGAEKARVDPDESRFIDVLANDCLLFVPDEDEHYLGTESNCVSLDKARRERKLAVE